MTRYLLSFALLLSVSCKPMRDRGASSSTASFKDSNSETVQAAGSDDQFIYFDAGRQWQYIDVELKEVSSSESSTTTVQRLQPVFSKELVMVRENKADQLRWRISVGSDPISGSEREIAVDAVKGAVIFQNSRKMAFNDEQFQKLALGAFESEQRAVASEVSIPKNACVWTQSDKDALYGKGCQFFCKNTFFPTNPVGQPNYSAPHTVLLNSCAAHYNQETFTMVDSVDSCKRLCDLCPSSVIIVDEDPSGDECLAMLGNKGAGHAQASSSKPESSHSSGGPQ